MCNLWKPRDNNGTELYITLFAPIAGCSVEGCISYTEFRILLVILRNEFRNNGRTHPMKLDDFEEFLLANKATISRNINKLLSGNKIFKNKAKPYYFQYSVNREAFNIFTKDDYLWKRYSRSSGLIDLELGVPLYHEIAYTIIKKEISSHEARLIVLILALSDFSDCEYTPPQTLERLSKSTHIHISDISKALNSLESGNHIEKNEGVNSCEYRITGGTFYCPCNENYVKSE